MLSTYFAPTEGDGFMNRMSVALNGAFGGCWNEHQSIRRVMGLCEQENNLWDNFTVYEHLYFYGLMKVIFDKNKSGEIHHLTPFGVTRHIYRGSIIFIRISG